MRPSPLYRYISLFQKGCFKWKTRSKCNVRIALYGETAWFVGVDVCRALGYDRPDLAIKRHVAKVDKAYALVATFQSMNAANETAPTLHRQSVDREEHETKTPLAIEGVRRKMLIINESGLYSLVLSANTPEAQKFKHWVTSEVLPAIRKTGSYSLLETPGQDLPVVEQSPDQFQISLEPLALADKLLEVADKFSDPQLRDKVLIHVINNLCGRNIF